jgi:hypothetical protein
VRGAGGAYHFPRRGGCTVEIYGVRFGFVKRDLLLSVFLRDNYHTSTLLFSTMLTTDLQDVRGDVYHPVKKIGIDDEQDFSAIGRYSMFSRFQVRIGIGWLILGTCSIIQHRRKDT